MTDRDFDKRLEALSYRHDRWRVFGDFCEMAALALANFVPRVPAREERYAQIVRSYSQEEGAGLSELLAFVVRGLDDPEPADFLGAAFMRNELSSHWAGQFFTPMNVCRMMASVTLASSDARAVVEERGFVTAMEPACGSGAMVIALAGALREIGIEPQRHLHVTAVDVAPVCAHMATVQLSLLAIPAVVILGDSLSAEYSERFETPAHHLGFWPANLRRGAFLPEALQDPHQAAQDGPQGPQGQLRLF